MTIQGKRIQLWAGRALITAVTLMNLQAAFQFMLFPKEYAWGFELGGTPGSAMMQGVGLLFLMWNIPYIFAAVHPVKNFISLIEAVIMQFIGVVGESWLLSRLPGEHPLINASVGRFIIFDGAGLGLLIVALLLCWKEASSKRKDKANAL